MTTVAGVVHKPLEAQRMIDELTRECMCDRADISVLVRDAGGWSSQDSSGSGATLKQGIDAGRDATKTILDGLCQGFESATRSLPGGGMLRAFGSIGGTVLNAGVAGAAELAKALVDMGVPNADARFYSEAFERGDLLVAINAKSEHIAQCARKTMMKYGAVAPESRAAA